MGRGLPPAPPIPMTDRQYRLLEKEYRKRTTLQQNRSRIGILLGASRGESNSQVSRSLGVALNTVKSWRNRWEKSYPDLVKYASGPAGDGISDRALLNRMLELLKDLPRSGKPKEISLEQEQQIIALACQKPEDYGIPVTDWTHEMLAKVAIAQGIVERISGRWVGSILKKTNFIPTNPNIGSSPKLKTGKPS